MIIAAMLAMTLVGVPQERPQSPEEIVSHLVTFADSVKLGTCGSAEQKALVPCGIIESGDTTHFVLFNEDGKSIILIIRQKDGRQEELWRQ